ncbi:uncharacterized protein LOC101852632 [Aplysia californica]|uniref:Uncharacterized protein LOC101852632 n=1 Tax=Aplysia californica TaxID=6500 RepID=A0ABM0JS33_APLCA|nr:uncharacterized protein LOC101852632 [Aplysia californica]
MFTKNALCLMVLLAFFYCPSQAATDAPNITFWTEPKDMVQMLDHTLDLFCGILFKPDDAIVPYYISITRDKDGELVAYRRVSWTNTYTGNQAEGVEATHCFMKAKEDCSERKVDNKSYRAYLAIKIMDPVYIGDEEKFSCVIHSFRKNDYGSIKYESDASVLYRPPTILDLAKAARQNRRNALKIFQDAAAFRLIYGDKY